MINDILQIEDYESRYNIVITSTKIIKYYEIVKLKNEIYF